MLFGTFVHCKYVERRHAAEAVEKAAAHRHPSSILHGGGCAASKYGGWLLCVYGMVYFNKEPQAALAMSHGETSDVEQS